MNTKWSESVTSI